MNKTNLLNGSIVKIDSNGQLKSLLMERAKRIVNEQRNLKGSNEIEGIDFYIDEKYQIHFESINVNIKRIIFPSIEGNFQDKIYGIVTGKEKFKIKNYVVNFQTHNVHSEIVRVLDYQEKQKYEQQISNLSEEYTQLIRDIYFKYQNLLAEFFTIDKLIIQEINNKTEKQLITDYELLKPIVKVINIVLSDVAKKAEGKRRIYLNAETQLKEIESEIAKKDIEIETKKNEIITFNKKENKEKFSSDVFDKKMAEKKQEYKLLIQKKEERIAASKNVKMKKIINSKIYENILSITGLPQKKTFSSLITNTISSFNKQTEKNKIVSEIEGIVISNLKNIMFYHKKCKLNDKEIIQPLKVSFNKVIDEMIFRIEYQTVQDFVDKGFLKNNELEKQKEFYDSLHFLDADYKHY